MVEGQRAEVESTAVTAISARAARVWLALAIVAIGMHVAIAWYAREPGLLTGQDDAEYIVLGQSILQGGYNELFRVDSPLHRTYPPAYPAALALWSLVFGDHYDAYAALNILFSAVSLAVLFFVVRRLFDPRVAGLAVLVLAFNPILVEFAGSVRAEPLYVLCSLIGLYWVLVADERRQWLGPAVFAILVAVATRSVGVTLLAGVGAHWLMAGKWKRVGVPAGAVALVLIGWFVWSAAAPDQFVGTSYMAELRSMWAGTDWTGPLPGRAFRYLRGYVTTGVPYQLALPTVAGTIVDNVAGVLVAGSLIVVGMVAFARRWRPAFLYLLAYAGLLLVWIFYVGRFVEPIVPLLVVAMLLGATVVGSKLGRRGGPIAPVLVAVLLLAGALPRTQALLHSRLRCDRDQALPDPACMSREQAAFFDAIEWIDRNAPPDAVFLTTKTGALYRYTGRRSIGFEPAIFGDSTTFIDRVRDDGARWILLGSVHFREPGRLAPLLQASCRNLELVKATPPLAYVFRVPETGAASNDEACNALEVYREATASIDFVRMDRPNER